MAQGINTTQLQAKLRAARRAGGDKETLRDVNFLIQRWVQQPADEEASRDNADH